MGIKVWFSNKLELLAERCCEEISEQARTLENPFYKFPVLVPNRNVQFWLERYAACKLQIAVNLSFGFLEKELWRILLNHCHRESAEAVELIDRDMLNTMIISILLSENNDPALQPLVRYFLEKGEEQEQPSFASPAARKLVQICERLSNNLVQYEYSRPELLKKWMSEKQAFADSEDDDVKKMEVAQSALYRRLFGPKQLVEKTGEERGKRLITLTAFAEEVMDSLEETDNREPVFLFGISLVSPFHRRLLYHLGQVCDLYIFELSACSEFWDDINTPAETRWKRIRAIRKGKDKEGGETLLYDSDENELLQAWGKAGRETVKLFNELEEESIPLENFEQDFLHEQEPFQVTVLRKAQEHILKRKSGKTDTDRIKQDLSIQVAGCPSLRRELETVHNSILWNLERDPGLKLSDIAVIVPNLNKYLPAIRAVCEEYADKLPFNILDADAGSESEFGIGVNLLLDLARSWFQRKTLFALFENDAFMRKNQLTDEEVHKVVEWIVNLNIYRNYAPSEADSSEKYTCWEWGMQRGRLARIMASCYAEPGSAGTHYEERVPEHRGEQLDPSLLEKVSLIVDALFEWISLPCSQQKEALWWKDWLITGIQSFLEPSDDEVEIQRELFKRLIRCFEILQTSESLSRQRSTGIGLSVVAELCRTYLRDISATASAFRSSAVTIAKMQPMRPIPFKIIYVVGLGEGEFPKPEPESLLDLRKIRRKLGDITHPELCRYMFLETLLSAREKLYLSFVSKDIQKDRTYFPCSIVKMLISYIEKNILVAGEKFQISEMPFNGYDLRYAEDDPEREKWSDLFINYRAYDFWLRTAEIASYTDGKSNPLKERVKETYDILVKNKGNTNEPDDEIKISTRFLEDFLKNPIEASLKAMKIYGEDLEHSDYDEYPDTFLATPSDHSFIRRVLQYVLFSDSTWTLSRVRSLVSAYYCDLSRRGEVPSGRVGEIAVNSLWENFATLIQNVLGYKEKIAQISKEKYKATLFSRETHSIEGTVRYDPLLIQIEKRTISIEGKMGGFFLATGDGSLHIPVISTSSRGFLPSQGTSAYLLVLILRALNQPEGCGKFVLDSLSEKGAGEEQKELSVSPDEAEKIVRDIVEDCLNENAFDLLPNKLLDESRIKDRLLSGNTDDLDEEIQDTLKRKLFDKGYGGALTYFSPLKIITHQELHNPSQKLRNRFAPLLQSERGR